MSGLASFVGDVVARLGMLSPIYAEFVGEAPTFEYLRTRETPISDRNIWVIHEGLGTITRAGTDYAAELRVRVVCEVPNQNFSESVLTLDTLVEQVVIQMSDNENYKLLQGGGVENFNMFRLFSLHYAKDHYFRGIT